MARAAAKSISALVAHGGAGPRGPQAERIERRRGMLAAMHRGVELLRRGSSALDAVVAVVTALEDHPLFNAGYGSLLNSEGEVEMDASVMVAAPADEEPALAVDARQRQADSGARSRKTRSRTSGGAFKISAGAVAAVSRVKNPIVLARVVMEHSPHILMAAAGAEEFARQMNIRLCRPNDLITERARERWRSRQAQRLLEQGMALSGHGTVGAVALDARGALAAATSTGGVPGKLAGRVGDSALIGAGTFASALGAASATGQGEAIIIAALCREAVVSLGTGAAPEALARRAIAGLIAAVSAEAGVILVNRRGQVGFAHNAASMQVAAFDPRHGLRHLWVAPISAPRMP